MPIIGIHWALWRFNTLESLMITKESWGVGKIVWSSQIFFIFCIKHWANNSIQEFCFLMNLLTRLLTSNLTSKMIGSTEGKTGYATTLILRGHGYLSFLSFFVHGPGDNSWFKCVTSRLIITKFHNTEKQKASWS